MAYRNNAPNSDSSLSGSDEGSIDSFEQDLATVVDDETLGSPGTTTSTSGLPLAIQKQLVRDIVQAGGIDTFSLALLQEEKPEYASTDLVKRQVQNKVGTWRSKGKRSQRQQYEKLKSAVIKEQNKSPNTPPKASNNNKRRFRTPLSNSSKPSPSPAKQQQLQPPPQPLQPPPPPVHQILQFQPQPSTMSSMTPALKEFLSNAGKVIELPGSVDPLATYPLIISEITEYPDGKAVHSGFSISLHDVDPEMLATDQPQYEAMHDGKSAVYIKKNLYSHAYLHNPSLYEEGLKNEAAGDDSDDDDDDEDGWTKKKSAKILEKQKDRVVEGWKVARNFIAYKIKFEQLLNNGVFSPESENGEISPAFIPVAAVEQGVNDDGNSVAMVKVRVTLDWRIAVAVEEHNKRKTVVKKKKNPNQAAVNSILKGFKSMKMNEE